MRNESIALIEPEITLPTGQSRGQFVAAPLERGFGITLGNALRRVMLSSLPGAAITSARIEGVVQEFSTIPHVREGVPYVLQNLKKVAIEMVGAGRQSLTLRATKAGPVTAGMIQTVSGVTIHNPDLVLCHLDEGGTLEMHLKVQVGRGYRFVDRAMRQSEPVGSLLIDAFFSPVVSVAYKVLDERVGQATDYDRLLLDVETNGALSPAKAVATSARLLQGQFGLFVKEELVQKVVFPVQETRPEISFDPVLLRKVEELELSVRSANCLEAEGIVYIGDLVTKAEAQMLDAPNFGRKSLHEVKGVLTSMDLKFGTEVPGGWPPDNLKELVDLYGEN